MMMNKRVKEQGFDMQGGLGTVEGHYIIRKI